MEEHAALAKLISPDENAARCALDELFKHSAPRLARYVARALQVQSADAQDVVQETFRRVWVSRLRLEFVDGARWQRFLQTVARNFWLDRAGADAGHTTLTDHADLMADS